MVGTLESFSISFLADKEINHTFLQAFLMITFKLSLTAFCWPTQGHNKSVTLTMKEWGIRNSLICLPLASISSDKVQQSLSPGTLVLIAEHIGLMATQATKFNKNRVQIT